MQRYTNSVSYFRNFIFGVEDSLVSTVGLLSGIAIAGVAKETIFVTGVVLIFVEAFSMAAGSFLSEYSAEGFIGSGEDPSRGSFISGVIMFFSYAISGIIPLSPYLILPVGSALKFSVILSVLALFVLGVISGRVSKINVVKSGMRMAVIGGIAIAVGLAAGAALS